MLINIAKAVGRTFSRIAWRISKRIRGIKSSDDKKRTREEFLEETVRFFDNGMIRELYYNDAVSILNIADMTYAVTDYTRLSSGYVGWIFDSATINYISSYDYAFYTVCSTMSRKAAINQLLIFDDCNYNKMCQYYEYRKQNGPSRDIDRKLEKELQDRNEKEHGMKNGES